MSTPSPPQDSPQDPPQVSKQTPKPAPPTPVNDLKFYPDNPTDFKHKAQFSTKLPSQFYDPCQQASKMSISCLERNDYDKDMCIEYFKAYKECRQEWMDQRKKDRRSGFSW